MQRVFREELHRAVTGRGMQCALLIGGGISIAHIIQYMIPAYCMNAQMQSQWEMRKQRMSYPLCIADSWLAGNQFNLESFVYFLVMPILAVLPFGISYFTDKETGYLKNLYARTARNTYLKMKYAAVFLSGGTAVVLPLLLNLGAAAFLLPNLPPPLVLTQNGIDAAKVFYELYFAHPMIYIGIFLVLDFLMGGMFACLALACSDLSDHKVVVLMCPFFVQLFIHVVCTISYKTEYSSVFFLQSGFGLLSLWVPIVYLVLGIGVSWLIFQKRGEREDVF